MDPGNNPFDGRFPSPMLVSTGGSSSILKGAIAGGLTGGLEVAISYPTEFVKTQLQLDGKEGAKKYTGVLDCVKKTVQEKGVLGLYRGLAVLIYGSIPKAGVRFGAFETLKTWFVDERGNMGAQGRVLCGLGAGVCEAIFVVTPMETIKVKFINDMRSPNPKYKGFLHGVKEIIREKGVPGIYQGVTPTIFRQGSNQAIRFYCMETMKDLYRGGDPSKTVPTPITGAMGVLAGAASVFGNTPLDVVKTRMQGLEAHKYKGTVDCFTKIWKEEGPRAFYKGTVPRLYRVCLDVAITFMIYDSFMELFQRIWP